MTQNFTKPDVLPNGKVVFDDPTYPLQPGDIVIPFFEAGSDSDRNQVRTLLVKEKRYLVRRVEVYPLRTEVYLERFAVSFNMVTLEKVKD